jgi:hypothetical protein
VTFAPLLIRMPLRVSLDADTGSDPYEPGNLSLCVQGILYTNWN